MTARVHRIRRADGTLLEEGWLLQVVSLARLGGWHAFHAPDNRPGKKTGRPQPVIGNTTGFPDLILTRTIEMLAVELKTDTGRMGPGQQDWLDRLAMAGAETAVWRPRDFEAVQARLLRPAPDVAAALRGLDGALDAGAEIVASRRAAR